MAKEALASSQRKMKKRYDQRSTARSFQPGDEVLILSPVSSSSLSTKFTGPYVIERKVSATN